MVLGLAAGLGQSGFLLTTQPIVPKLEKISPLAGFKRLFSLKSIVEFIKGVLKLAIVAAIAYALVSPEMDRAEELLDMDLIDVLRVIQTLVIRRKIGVVAFMFAVAIADYLYQRFEFMKQMRMSRQELRAQPNQSEERKSVGGGKS